MSSNAPTLEIVFGSSAQGERERALRETLHTLSLHGHLYFAYPVYEAVDGVARSDALLTCKEHGVVIFDLTAPPFDHTNPEGWHEEIASRQDELHRNLHSKLYSNKDLVERRQLAVTINVVTLLADVPDQVREQNDFVVAPKHLADLVSSFGSLDVKYERALNATIQRVSTIKPVRRRDNVTSDTSHGGIIRKIEANIANLDAWQKKGAITYPEGPQRIRGLAGSGKTIVLALKAAYLHATHPEWNIVVTYYSRSLRQQFEDLIRRFMFEHKKDEPNWEKLKIMHCWGGKTEAGTYSEISKHLGKTPTTWAEANRLYGDLSFKGVCDEIEKAIDHNQGGISPLYDAVLIDEAQDLPTSFFRMVYAVTKAPKRIIWAYDELQNLGEYSMPSVSDLFGRDQNGEPKVRLENRDDRPQQDIILPVCYRNTPWALTVAHGLGFGVARRTPPNEQTPLVQMFDEPKLWEDIGYEPVSGQLVLGKQVTLKRDPANSPDFFTDPSKRLIAPEDAVQFLAFEDQTKQAEWVAGEIAKDLRERELQYKDILVILPSAWTSRSQSAVVTSALRKLDIGSHLVGVSSSRDEMFVDNSVAITHIYRAKGNEAPMVYFIHADECFAGLQLAKKRNVLFTAITRSRAWVRVCGLGQQMRQLIDEYEKIVEADYALSFHYPTAEQIARMKKIHRDRSVDEQKRIEQSIGGVADLLDMIRAGELSVEQLPAELLSEVKNLFQRDDE